MKAPTWLLATLLVVLPVTGGETTNLIEILRSFQAQLDATEALPQPSAPIAPPSQPNAPSPSPTESAAPRTATLQPGDILNLQVAGEPNLSTNRLEVAKDGTSTLPLIRVKVALKGRTLEQARQLIHTLLAEDYLVDPAVELYLVRAAQRAFSLSGQVRSPGEFRFPPEGEVTIVSAIEMAGGATRRADLTRVAIRREAQGETREFIVNVEELNRGRSLPLPRLEPGDWIEIPAR